jgi:hypothetical protein
MVRPVKLVMPSAVGSAQIIMFRYFSSESADYMDAENNPQGGYTWVLYDLMDGLFPGRSVTLSAATASQLTVTVGQTPFPAGTYLTIPGYGASLPAAPPPGANVLPADYYGLVTSVGGQVMQVAPGFAGPFGSPPAGTAVLEIRRKLLRLVPALTTGATGRLWYQFTRERLVSDGDLIEPLVAEHIDCLVAYALSRLKLSVGDADTDRWLSQAEAMRSEMMQDVDLGSWQNTEHLGSDLIGLVDW